MYRYRGNRGVTRKSLTEMVKHLHKIGTPLLVRGYWYNGRYGKNAAVMVRGTLGTARFGGFSWGYGGEGPRGLEQLLQRLNVSAEQIKEVLRTPWEEEVREHWRINLAA